MGEQPETAVEGPFIDPELAVHLAQRQSAGPAALRPADIPAARAARSLHQRHARARIEDAGLLLRDILIHGHRDAEITVTIVERAPLHQGALRPVIFFLHGGGMVLGNALEGLDEFIPAVMKHGAVLVSVSYRLAPEFPDPTPVEDCYAALHWLARQSEHLKIDPTRIVVAGGSAGGGLAAGVALLARERQGPFVAGQMLMSPMLDDREYGASARQYAKHGSWNAESNRTGWSALLGDRRASDQVSIFAAPGRAEDLHALPPTYIDCGASDLFRDEDVAFASKLWAASVPTELHVWVGAFHGFEGVAPSSKLAQAAVSARAYWLDRVLGCQ